jgi:hypothetical protein
MVANVCETLGQNSGTRDKRGGDPDVSAAYSEHRFRARLGRLHDVQIRRDGDRARDRKKAFRTDGREYRRKRVGPSKDPIWAISERNLKSAGGILLAEDSALNGEMGCRLLESAGTRASTAEDDREVSG